MARLQRATIAINSNGERIEYASEYTAAKALGVSLACIKQAKQSGCFTNGWRVYDTPEYLRHKIVEIEEQIKMLEN